MTLLGDQTLSSHRTQGLLLDRSPLGRLVGTGVGLPGCLTLAESAFVGFARGAGVSGSRIGVRLGICLICGGDSLDSKTLCASCAETYGGDDD